MNSIKLNGSYTLYGFADYWSMRNFRDSLEHSKWSGELAWVSEMQAKLWVSNFGRYIGNEGYQNYRYLNTATPSKDPTGTALQSLYSAVAMLEQPVKYIVVV